VKIEFLFLNIDFYQAMDIDHVSKLLENTENRFQKILDAKESINQSLVIEHRRKEAKLLGDINHLNSIVKDTHYTAEMTSKLNSIISKLKEEILVLKKYEIPFGCIVLTEKEYQVNKDNKQQVILLNNIISECKSDISKLTDMFEGKKRNIEFLKRVKKNNLVKMDAKYNAILESNQTLCEENIRLKKQIEDIRKLFPDI